MKPKYEPCPGSAPGPFYVVAGACLHCWAATTAAPALMSFVEVDDRSHPHCRFHRQPESDEEVIQAVNAVNTACLVALRYAGTEKTILDRIGDPEACDAMPR